ncbi:MAG: ATP-binding cassette domain-containing protein [Streptosporangiales bacterium]|nr:ATP-binding cassette domain-containing protein [Streptosporangiales bacterium]
MIEVEGVTHTYGDFTALRDVSVALDERRVGLIGANGSGKSTFARLLNGLVVPSRGRVRVDGLDTARDGRKVRRRVGFCFTDPDAQIVMPTVAEDVAFSLRRSGLPRAEIDAKVAKTLATFGLTDYADHPAHQLSGGQKQLLALSSVLVLDPALLVCDEPTTLLDLRNTRQVVEILHDLPQHVVLVTHDLATLTGFDRVLVFDGGRIVCDAPPAEAVARYEEMMQ